MGMGRLGDQTREETDAELSAQEAELLAATSTDLEALRPQVGDSALYDELIRVVTESTNANESLAQLQDRLRSLGAEGTRLVRRVIQLAT